jgi:predicted dehydrogenase
MAIDVGIIGLGPAWESRYRPALERLRDRIAVRGVFDPVACRARKTAEELGTSAAEGIVPLTERRRLRALLLFDPGWSGLHGVRLAASGERPVFVAGALGAGLAAWRGLRDEAAEKGWTIVPEFACRYAPASGRLRELFATRLGRPTSVRLQFAAQGANGEAAPRAESGCATNGSAAAAGPVRTSEAADWCAYLIGTPAVRVAAASCDDGWTARLEFRAPKSGGAGAVAEWDVRSGADGGCTAHIVCERGEAVVTGPRDLTWTAGDAVGEHRECLTTDRDEVDVLLDHFCRRAAGGLVSTADPSDACRALAVAAALGTSLAHGGTAIAIDAGA